MTKPKPKPPHVWLIETRVPGSLGDHDWCPVAWDDVRLSKMAAEYRCRFLRDGATNREYRAAKYVRAKP